MKFKKLAPKKNAAQAIVEFAIVLPLLLLLLYGLLEAGRLLFIYSSVVNASRQAARYGSVTGQGSDFSAAGGPSNTGVKRYQDCEGIKWSAQRTDFLDAFEDDDITIEYDGGQGATASFVTASVDDQCDGSTDNTINPSVNNTDRITVTVSATFHAIVPKIVPFFTRTIEATSSRTILREIKIPAPGSGGGGGGGGGGATPTMNFTVSPGSAEPDQLVTLTVTLSGSSGTPTGTVTFVDQAGTTVCTATVTSGIATCNNIFFTAPGNYTITATYNPDTSDYITATANAAIVIGKSSTVTTVSDSPDPSLPNNSVTISVTVSNQYPGSSNPPTGTVTVTTAAGGCNITLSGGTGSCPITFNATGTSTITATYNPDSTHTGSSGTAQHTVSTSIPPTAVPTAIPTAIPTTIPTPVPTSVPGCDSIKNAVGAIKYSGQKMILDIPNTNNYPVTVDSVFVAWNYSAGHSPGDSSLWLREAKLNSTVFWSNSTGISQPNAKLPLSTAVVIPANGTAQLTFTFDKVYNRQSGEQIHIYFSTRGCEGYPVLVPASSPTITPVPPASAKLQYMAADVTVGDNQIKPHFNIVNTGSSALPLSGLKIRYWYTREGTTDQSFYCDYAVVNCSYVTGTFVPVSPARTGADYYLEISFTAAAGSISAGGQSGQIQARFNKTDWSNYTETGDYSFDPTKTSFADWTRVTLYYNGVLIWGTEP